MKGMNISRSIAVLVANLLLVLFVSIESRQTILKIVNAAGHPIDVLWIDEITQTTLSQLPKPLPNNSEALIDTFDNHKFIIRLLDTTSTTTTTTTTSTANQLETIITKQPIDETVIVQFNDTTKSLFVTIPDQYDWMRKKIDKLIHSHCHQSLEEGSQEFSNCIREGIAAHIKTAHEQKNMLRKFQDEVSTKLRNYTCNDEHLETSVPEYYYEIKIGEKSYTINVLLDLPHAKIWYVENLITPEECKVLEDHGRPKLHRATVAAEDGTSVVSEHRKAQQASYDFHQHHGEADPLWDLQHRVLALTNYHANYSLDTPGQEGFTIIQYNPADEYFPHCDGSCDNSYHVKTGRVATALMYCKAPEKGGATVFTRSNILVRPKLGSATFFAYKGNDGRMDDGYTEHTGCPVKEGEKWITTFWMREGVTAEENWTLYDPSGIRILETS